MLKISIVIPIYNRLEITKAGLANIYSSLQYLKEHGNDFLSINTIVVDDGSTDGSAEWIKLNYQDAIILIGNGNLWWSGGINMGAHYAIDNLKSSHILLWNDDTTCDIKYFYELEKFILKNDIKYRNAILVSKIFWLHDKKRLFNFGAYFNDKTGKKRLLGANQIDKFDNVEYIDWSGGMGTLIPKEILQKIKYFDDVEFPQYHGDLDFFLRAKKAGYHSYAIPTLKIYNNIDTTGQIKADSWRSLKTLCTSNRSIYNWKQNYSLNKRHSNTLISWIYFFATYAKIAMKTLKNSALPSKKTI